MLILFFCTYFATFGYKRPCDFETLFHIVARVFPAISACFNTSVGTAFDNAVRQDLAKIDEFINLIKLYCQALDEIITKYVDSEQRNLDVATQRTYH